MLPRLKIDNIYISSDINIYRLDCTKCKKPTVKVSTGKGTYAWYCKCCDSAYKIKEVEVKAKSVKGRIKNSYKFKIFKEERDYRDAEKARKNYVNLKDKYRETEERLSKLLLKAFKETREGSELQKNIKEELKKRYDLRAIKKAWGGNS